MCARKQSSKRMTFPHHFTRPVSGSSPARSLRVHAALPFSSETTTSIGSKTCHVREGKQWWAGYENKRRTLYASSFSLSRSLSPEEVWTVALNELSQRIRRYFVRREPHQRALTYLQGLMSSVERKNGWQVAEAVGEATPYAMQHLLDRAKWDCKGSARQSTGSSQ